MLIQALPQIHPLKLPAPMASATIQSWQSYIVGWSCAYALLARILTIVNTLFLASLLAKPVHGKFSNNTTTIRHYK